MFGNLDDIKHTRSMVTILSSTNVDLLTVPTEIFYYRLRDYPVVRNRIQKHILLENLVSLDLLNCIFYHCIIL